MSAFDYHGECLIVCLRLFVFDVFTSYVCAQNLVCRRHFWYDISIAADAKVTIIAVIPAAAFATEFATAALISLASA